MSGRFEKLFATLVYQAKLPSASTWNKGFLKEIESYSSQDKMGQEWSKINYKGGYTSYASLNNMQHRSRIFSDLSDKLQGHAKTFAKTQGWNLRGLKLVMTDCWINIMPQGTYHSLHLHPHSVISGTYYVAVPKGSVALKLEDPRMALYMNAPVGRASLYKEITPEPGKIILFESWLRHEVPPNLSKTPRVSISFNYSLE